MRARLIVIAVVVVGVGIGMTAVAAAGGGGCHDPVPAEAKATTTIVMDDFCIRPGVAHIEVGDTVEVVNDDSVLHNLFGPDWYHGDLAPGARARRTFEEPGTYTFACTLHPGMTGAINVGDVALISATSTSAEGDDGGGMSGIAVAGIALGAVFCLGSGWGVGRLTARAART